ncbi:MAG: GNAT family N-acetyltransferase [Pseudomonadota bacterium]
MWIRRFVPADAAGCAEVFYRAVHEGAAAHYSEAQRRAWAPAVPKAQAFAERLGGQHCFVADAEPAIEGFMSLTDRGYLDMAFVAPERRGTGLADQLLSAMMNVAHLRGLRSLHVDASRLAQPFFARHGWQVGEAETVSRGGISIPRAAMSLRLRD